MKHHQIFYARTQEELTVKNFHPTEEELDFAKKSLIEKHKISNGIQQLLFCKKGNEEEEFLSMNERNIIQNERKKYIEFIRRNYNQKISEELFNLNKLKTRIKEFQERERMEKQREEDQLAGKKVARVAVAKRKIEEKPTAGKKKLKTEAKQTVEKPAPTPKGKKAQPKKQPQNIPAVPQPLQEFQEQPSPEQSLSLNLINSLSEDEYQNDYE